MALLQYTERRFYGDVNACISQRQTFSYDGIDSDAVWKNEMWWDCKVDSKSFRSFKFHVSERKAEFMIHFDVNVSGDGLDIRFILYTYANFQKITEWMKNKTQQKLDSNGNVVYNKDGFPVIIDVPKPEIDPVFEVKTNILNRTVPLLPGKYGLLFDNTHSVVTGKNLDVHIVETWGKENTRKDLPIKQHLDGLPSNVVACINDANDCYVEGHYNQCAVMLRKGIEQAIKTKISQSDIPHAQLLDVSKNEMGLSSMITTLKENKLITSRNASNVNNIKWFGNEGAHGTMRVAEQDIKDNVEPKIRSFFEDFDLEA